MRAQTFYELFLGYPLLVAVAYTWHGFCPALKRVDSSVRNKEHPEFPSSGKSMRGVPANGEH